MPISRRLSVLVPLVAATVASAADMSSVQLHGFASQGYMRTQGDLYEGSLWMRLSSFLHKSSASLVRYWS